MKWFRSVALALIAAMPLQGAYAALTNIWPFTDPAQYAVSDPSKIEVADGVAKLKLQAADRYDSSLADYQTNGTSASFVGLGPDVTLSFGKVGGAYPTSGSYVSRVIDGGIGNLWVGLNTKAYNLDLLNALNELPSSTSNLVGVFHLNNSWINSVTGTNATPFNGPTFTTSARVGPYAASFNNSPGQFARTDVIADGFTQYSICFWIKPTKAFEPFGALVIAGTPGSYANTIGFYEISSGDLEFYINKTRVVTTSKPLSINQWSFVAGTWQGETKTASIYVNGVLLNSATLPTTAAITQNDPFYINTELGIRVTASVFDEIMFFNKTLSAREVYDLYQRPASVVYQVRAGVDLDDLATAPFVGPGGDTNTYYSSGNQVLVYGGAFKHWGQYAQYSAIFAGPQGGSQTPYLDAAGLLGTRSQAFDDTVADFSRGVLSPSLIVAPAVFDNPYMGLAKQPNGGYYKSGQFTSVPVDGGGPTIWDRLKWTIPQGLSLTSDMMGFWRMEGGFGDDGPYGYNATTVINVDFTAQAKLGSQAAVFSGPSTATIGSLGTNVVKAIEFWIQSDYTDGGILQFCNNATNNISLILSGRLVIPVGFSVAPSVVVNGSVTSRRLGPGWNHVGVSIPAGVSPTEFILGVANGVYFAGMLDEMAIYNRAVTAAEFKNHFVAGRRASAGRAKFQVRAGNSLPLTGPFVGPNDLSAVFFLDNTGNSVSLPGSVVNKRYLQYQVTFAGDGVSTPTFGSVVVSTVSGVAYTNATEQDFLPGTFSETRWVGDEMKLLNLATVPGLVNLAPDADTEGLWRMDEALWNVTTPVEDSSFNPKPGTAYNGATTYVPGQVGAACGVFDGVNDHVAINGVMMPGDFSMLVWFKTKSTARAAAVSRADGACTIEVNGNGSGIATGRVAFAVNNAGTNIAAVASAANLNDGAWHHVAGIRRGQTIHIYVDGVPSGSALLTSSTGLGGGALYLARHGTLGSYMAGNLDEFVIYSRALSDGEVRQIAAMDANTKATATYTSRIFDAGQPAIWQSIAWRENAPFEKALTNGDISLLGLWHLDETNGLVATDSSGLGNDGTIAGGASRASGKFGSCLALDGSSGFVTVQDSAFLEPSALSVEAWVKLGAVGSSVVFDKRTAVTGYALGTDASGKPYFWVGGVTALSMSGLQPSLWYHLAGTYDGKAIKISVNGDVTGSTTGSVLNATGNNALIGRGYDGGGSVLGSVDEVAVWGRALNAEEIMDHARAGAGALRVQIRIGADTNTLETVPFIGPDGTSNTHFTASSKAFLLSLNPLGRYFQYKVALSAEDGFRAPVFQGATIEQTGYPIDNPWVAPATGYGQSFLGKLVSLRHILFTNTDVSIRYQVSGDNGTNWYAWIGSQWENVTALDNPDTAWTMANPRATLDANIGTFYDSLYAKTGGVFKFKAYLKSDAINQVAVDEVSLLYSSGRIVVTVPNGAEVGKEAWLVGVPYRVQWTSAGVVPGLLKLEYRLNSSASWVTIATNVPNTGSYSFWTTPGAESASDHCRVQITAMNDASITDMSDSDFSLVQRFRMTDPNGGEKWYVGRSNTIRWMSAVGLGNLADLDYAPDGVNYSKPIKFGALNIPSSTNNSFVWATPTGDPELVSETGRIRVQPFGAQPGNTLFDVSDEYFTLAGIEITKPPAAALVNRRQMYPVEWMAAGAGPAVAVDFSANSGVTWTNVIASYTNQAGANTFDWNPAVQPTDTARLRVRSLSDTNVVGVSSNFVLADIDILAPSNNATWGMGLTNAIVWMAGGAGTNINIYYSTNSGGYWVPVVQRYPNTGGSNTYLWAVPRLPGTKTRIKIESDQDNNLFAVSPDFNIAGVRVTSPNAGIKWEKDSPYAVQWEYQSVGEGATLEFSYDGGVSYRNIGGPGVPLINRALGYTPVFPSVRAKAKITADDPSPFTNMVDESDGYFTVGGIQVTVPTTGTVYTLGTAGPVNWTSAGADDPLGQARLSYAAGGVTNPVAVVGNNEAFPGENSYTWNLSLQTDPSASARVIVQSGPYSGSSFPFTLRGMKFTVPSASSVYDVGGNGALVWRSAGIDESANGYFHLSTDGGVTFSSAINSAQVWTVMSGAYPWSIDPNADPVTNAVLNFVVAASGVPNDVGYEARSLPFVLRGMKVLTPAEGTVWAHGTTNSITWRSARAGTVATLYYSADGTVYETTPIMANAPLADGLNTYSWQIDAGRMPSTNAHVKVVSSVANAVSRPFVLQGIKVTAPLATDIWAFDETNRISWVGVGTTPPYTISLIQGGTNVLPIATGVNASFYDWAVPLAAVSSNAVIRVTDGRFTGDSPTFKVVGMPTIETIFPARGDLLRVSQTYDIVWSKGGKMDNDFHVMFSSAPYVATNDIFNGVANYNALDNTFSVPWTIPDRLGDTKIIIQHNTRADIRHASEPFKIVPYFRLVYPNGGDTNLFARKLSIVSWFTRGSQAWVDLYYSADPLHGTNSWVKINAAPIANNGQGVGDVVTTYDWETTDLGGDVSTVRLRVQAADVPGAYDDSDADFSIRYFKILWRVYDSATSNELTQLSVSDSSGWSEGDLSSPILHAYPFGAFDTVWAREYFYNNVIFNWQAEPSRVIEVVMRRSDVEPDYNVMANFVYDPTNALFRVNSWIERRGRILLTPSKCVITVFDINGNTAVQVTSTTPAANGVFWQNLPPTLQRGAVYFARVEIDYSAVLYSSGITFNLRVPTAEEQALQMMNTLSNVLSGVMVLNTNLNDLATAQAAFRASASGKLDFLTNAIGRIPGLTNLEAKIDNYSTQTLARLDSLTNTIGVLGSGDSNTVLDRLDAINREIGGKNARILTRPTSVKLGSLVDILYRSQAGATATISVSNSVDGEVVAPTSMRALSGGVFEKRVTANWGLGDYVITCEDSLLLSDKMILKVTATELDDVALSMGSVSGQLANIEFALDGMSASMSNVVAVVSTLGDLTNMAEQVAVMTNSLAKVAALTNMPSQMNGVVAAIGQLGSLTNLGPQVDQLTSVIGQITALTNMSGQLSTMSATMDQLGALTNLTPKVDAITASLTDVVALTNLYSQMDGVVGAINSLGSLTNLGPQVDLLTGAMGQVTALTNMASQMNQVIAAVNSLGSLTNLGPQVDLLTGAMGQITALTNMASQMNQVIAAVNSLGSLTNLGPQVDVLTASMDKITALTNMSGQVAYLTTTLNGMTNLGAKVDQLGTSLTEVAALTNLTSQMNGVVAAVNQLGSLTNMAGDVSYLTTTLNGMTNLPARVDSVLAGIGQLGSLTNLGGQVDALNGAMGEIMALTNMSGQINGLATGVAQLSAASVAMSNSIAQIYASLATLQSASNGQDSVSLMMPLVTAMETKIGSATDPAGSDTVFSRLYSIEENLGKVGGEASQAAKKAGSARTEAGNAASAITKVKDSVASGQIPKIMSDLAELRKALGATMSEAGGARDVMGPDKLEKAIRDAMLKIEEMAKGQGIKKPFGSGPEAPSPDGQPDTQTYTKLMDKMAETKAMMEAMRLLMDEAVNKPVVVDWLEGSQ